MAQFKLENFRFAVDPEFTNHPFKATEDVVGHTIVITRIRIIHDKESGEPIAMRIGFHDVNTGTNNCIYRKGGSIFSTLLNIYDSLGFIPVCAFKIAKEKTNKGYDTFVIKDIDDKENELISKSFSLGDVIDLFE